MKIFKQLCAALCLMALLGMCVTPCNAMQPQEKPMQDAADISVLQGCNTADALVPLCGSTKRLQTAGAAVLYEINTQTMMYAWNPDAQLAPAALVKIMTALLAVENADPMDVVTVSANSLAGLDKNSFTTDLQTGEVITLDHLLYCLMVGASNDAAMVIAHHIAGSHQGFAVMMNQRAAELGCTGTNFINPHGLHAEGQVTTARDMAKILAFAADNELFMQYFSVNKFTVPATNLSEERELSGSNYLMLPEKVQHYEKHVTGGRTGITSKRNRSIALTAEGNGLRYVAIVLEAIPTFTDNGTTVTRFGNYEEAKELVELGFSGFAPAQVLGSGQVMTQYPVINGSSDVAAMPVESVSTVLPSDISFSDLTFHYEGNGGLLTAPIEEGEPLAAVQVWYGNVCVARSSVTAANRVTVHTPLNAGIEDNEAADGSDILLIVFLILSVFAVPVVVLYVIRLIRQFSAKRMHDRRRTDRRRSK